MRNVKNKLTVLAAGGAAAFGALIASAMSAMPAFALGWDANQMIQSTTGSAGMSIKSINQQTLAQWVQSIATWVLGLCVVLFVLRVVLTAADRFVFGNAKEGNNAKGSMLSKIPIIGAYEMDVEWGTVFANFGKNLAIAAGAWLLVQIIVGVVLFIFGAVTQV